MTKRPEFSRLPGFRDFPPEDLALRSRIFEAWRRVSRRYGFLEYDAPPLEPLELYVEKSGEEIVGQLYAFTDKGDRKVAMRPEMTPSLARMLAERSRALPKPIRWFSLPQLFRYERQQRGRLREHFQWNVDVVGEGDEAADAEVLAVALDGLREMGLTSSDIRARVSDRRLLSALLRAVGVEDAELLAVFGVVDKIERMAPAAVRQQLEERIGLDGPIADRVIAMFELSGLDAISAEYGEDPEVSTCVGRLRSYVEQLNALGLEDFVEVDLRIVRGLAYYTGIVFEVFDRAGELRAICGGGRYDGLLERVGGESLPAVGFGMGDVVLSELLRDRDLVPEVPSAAEVAIVFVTPAQRLDAARVAAGLRRKGKQVVYALREQPLRKQFQSASNAGVAEVVVLGPDEAARGVAIIRDMGSGAEREVTLEELIGP